MEIWGWIIIIVIILAVIGLIAWAIWYFLFDQNSFNLCIGQMKEDGMCGDQSSYTADDYTTVKEQGVLTNIPDTLTTSADKSKAHKFMIGIYQKIQDNENFQLGTKYKWNYNLKTRGLMYVFENPENNLTDVFIFITPLKNYNDLYEVTDIPVAMGTSTTIKTLPYLNDAYTSFKATFDANYPDDVNNLYILTADDAASLGMRFRADYTYTDNIQLVIGEVSTFYLSGGAVIPNDPKMTTVYNSTHDKYNTVIQSSYTLTSTQNKIPDLNKDLVNAGDYHTTPYYLASIPN